MITSKNIKAYINYLHQKRTGNLASEDLLTKWGSLTDVEITSQLQNLYTHWNLDEIQAKVHEQNFITFSEPVLINEEPKPIKPIISNVPIQANLKVKKSNTGLLIFLSLLASVVIGSVIYITMNPTISEIEMPDEISQMPEPSNEVQKPAIAEDTTTNAIAQASKPDSVANTTPLPEAPIATSELALNEQDQINIASISNLLKAEVNKNFEDVASFYSPNIRQYWDIEQPSYEALEKRYKYLWDKIENAQNKDMHITKIANNKYKLIGTFDYWNIAKQEQRSVPIESIFEFDDEGKIIYTNKN